MIKNLSQLKKALVKGARFQIIEHFIFPERNGEIREVNVVQTNGIYTIIPDEPDSRITKANRGKGSWLGFGKASDWTFCNGVMQQSHCGKPALTIRMITE